MMFKKNKSLEDHKKTRIIINRFISVMQILLCLAGMILIDKTTKTEYNTEIEGLLMVIILTLITIMTFAIINAFENSIKKSDQDYMIKLMEKQLEKDK